MGRIPDLLSPSKELDEIGNQQPRRHGVRQLPAGPSEQQNEKHNDAIAMCQLDGSVRVGPALGPVITRIRTGQPAEHVEIPERHERGQQQPPDSPHFQLPMFLGQRVQQGLDHQADDRQAHLNPHQHEQDDDADQKPDKKRRVLQFVPFQFIAVLVVVLIIRVGDLVTGLDTGPLVSLACSLSV